MYKNTIGVVLQKFVLIILLICVAFCQASCGEADSQSGAIRSLDKIHNILSEIKLERTNRYLSHLNEVAALFRSCGLPGAQQSLYIVLQDSLYQYYTEQTGLGNEISQLEEYPYPYIPLYLGDGGSFEADIQPLYTQRVDSLIESIEERGLAKYYSKADELESPVNVTGEGICFVMVNSSTGEVRFSHEIGHEISMYSDSWKHFSPLSFADSPENARYVYISRYTRSPTHTIQYSDGTSGTLYHIAANVALIDVVTGGTLLTCEYFRHEQSFSSDFPEVFENQIFPVLSRILTVYEEPLE